MLRKKNGNSKYKLPTKRKIIIALCLIYIIGFSSFLFLFYGPLTGFKEFWITSAMTTKDHRYLATWLYSDKYKTSKVYIDYNNDKEYDGKE